MTIMNSTRSSSKKLYKYLFIILVLLLQSIIQAQLSCSGHGATIDSSTSQQCYCQLGFVGFNCQRPAPICNGLFSNDPNVCSGRGTCQSTGQCSCGPGFGGPNCEIIQNCFGIPADNPTVCGGAGTCTATDTCKCNMLYGGSACASIKSVNVYTIYNYATAEVIFSKISPTGMVYFLDINHNLMSYDMTTEIATTVLLNNNYCSTTTVHFDFLNSTHLILPRTSCNTIALVDMTSSTPIPIDWLGSTATDIVYRNGPFPQARFFSPTTVNFDKANSMLYVVEKTATNSRIRVADVKYKEVTTAIDADFDPQQVVPYFGTFMFAGGGRFNTLFQTYNNSLYIVSGSTSYASGNQEGLHYEALYNNPTSMITDSSGFNIYFADAGNNKIMIAGTSQAYSMIGQPNPTPITDPVDGIDGAAAFVKINSLTHFQTLAGDAILVSDSKTIRRIDPFFTCTGWESFSTSVCSGYGQCVENDVCQCQTGHAGTDCQDFVCFGQAVSDWYVCSGGGDCTGPDTCECYAGYYGDKCQYSSCYGLPGNDPNVCSSHGQCYDMDYCDCNENWGGFQCNIPYCFNEPADSFYACFAGGTCIAPNNCSCWAGYAGDNCDRIAPGYWGCNLYSNVDPFVCAGRGNCSRIGQSQDGLCSCAAGYYGPDCYYSTCFGKVGDTPEACSGSGLCWEKDQCYCNYGYEGNECQNYYCDYIHHNSSTVCTGRGQCIAPDWCSCKDGYGGWWCEETYCYGYGHSETGYVCSGKGKCMSPNNCKCNVGYFGVDCSLYKCFNKFQVDGNVCSGHGTCVSTDKCTCETGWSGADCSIPDCYGKKANVAGVCGGNGLCVEPNKCKCFQNSTIGFWDGDQCTSCLPSYMAPNSSCLTQICDASKTCFSHGTCNSALDCTCFESFTQGYWGKPFCQNCKTNYFGSYCTSYCKAEETCMGHGYCDNNGDCKCHDSNLLGFFQGSACFECKNGFSGSKCQSKVSSQLKFTENLDKLVGEITFSNVNTTTALPCSRLFDPNTIQKLGIGAICQIPTFNQTKFDSGLLQTFEVVLGFKPSITIGDSILMDINSLTRTDDPAPRLIRLTVAAPAFVNKPTATIVAPPQIGQCTDLFLDGSFSNSPSRGQLFYFWSAKSGQRASGINGMIDGDRNPYVVVPGFLMEAGSYNFSLRVESRFMMTVSSPEVIVTIKKVNNAFPSIKIKGPKTQTTTISTFYVIDADIALPPCIDDSASAIEIVWTQTAGPKIELNSRRNQLIFQPYTFPGMGKETTYTFKVTATYMGNAVFETVNVRVIPEELIASILGGDRQVSSNDNFTIFSNCIDPERNKNSEENYIWSCVNCPFGDLLVGLNSPNVTIPQKFVEGFDGTVYFTLMYVKGMRKAVAMAEIAFIDDIIPKASIKTTAKALSQKQKVLFYGEVEQSSSFVSYSYLWTVKNSRNEIIDLTTAALTPVNFRNLLLQVDSSFAPKATYKIILTVSGMKKNGEISTTEASKQVKYVEPPKPGSLKIFPDRDGRPFRTKFQIQALNWQSDYQLTYMFSYFDGDSEVSLCSYRQASSISTTLPPPAIGNSVKMRVRVKDELNSVTILDYDVIMAPPEADIRNSALNFTSDSNSLMDQTRDYMSSMGSLNRFPTNDTAEMNQRDAFRAKVLNSISSTFNQTRTSEPLDDQQISSQGRLLATLTANTNELSADNLNTAFQHSLSVLKQASSSISAPEDSLGPFVGFLGNLMSYQSSAKARNQARASGSNSMAKIEEMKEQIANLAKTKQIEGQKATSISSGSTEVIFYKNFKEDLTGKSISSGLNAEFKIPSSLQTNSSSTNNLIQNSESLNIKIMTTKTAPPFDSSLSNPSANVSSPVFSISVSDTQNNKLTIAKLDSDFEFYLPFNSAQNMSGFVLNTTQAGVRPQCKMWNPSSQTWSEEGCTVKNVTTSGVLCACKQITHNSVSSRADSVDTYFSATVEYCLPKLNLITVDDIQNLVYLADNPFALIVVLSMFTFYVSVLLLIFLADFCLFLCVRHNCIFWCCLPPEIQNKKKAEDSKFHPFYYLISQFHLNHALLSFLWVPSQEYWFTKAQRFTVIYTAVLGIFLGSAITTQRSTPNLVQFILLGFVTLIVAKPFQIIMTIMFLKTRPLNIDSWFNFIDKWIFFCQGSCYPKSASKKHQRRRQKAIKQKKEKEAAAITAEDKYHLQTPNSGISQNSNNVTNPLASAHVTFVNNKGETIENTQNDETASSTSTDSSDVNNQSKRELVSVHGDPSTQNRMSRLLQEANFLVKLVVLPYMAFQKTKSLIYRFMQIGVAPIVTALDILDTAALALLLAAKKFSNVMSWQGVIIIIIFTLMYIAGVFILLNIVLPQFYSFFTVEMVTFAWVGFVLLYFLFMQFTFVRIRAVKYADGTLKKWKVSIIQLILNLLLIVLFLIISAIAFVLSFVWYYLLKDSASGISFAMIAFGCLLLALDWMLFSLLLAVRPVGIVERMNKKRGNGFYDQIVYGVIFLPLRLVFWILFNDYWFPNFFKYIFFVVCWAYIAFASFLVVVYGVKFDLDDSLNKSSSEWIWGSIFGFGQDQTLYDPGKFVIKTIMLTIVAKMLELIFFADHLNLELPKDEELVELEHRQRKTELELELTRKKLKEVEKRAGDYKKLLDEKEEVMIAIGPKSSRNRIIPQSITDREEEEEEVDDENEALNPHQITTQGFLLQIMIEQEAQYQVLLTRLQQQQEYEEQRNRINNAVDNSALCEESITDPTSGTEAQRLPPLVLNEEYPTTDEYKNSARTTNTGTLSPSDNLNSEMVGNVNYHSMHREAIVETDKASQAHQMRQQNIEMETEENENIIPQSDEDSSELSDNDAPQQMPTNETPRQLPTFDSLRKMPILNAPEYDPIMEPSPPVQMGGFDFPLTMSPSNLDAEMLEPEQQPLQRVTQISQMVQRPPSVNNNPLPPIPQRLATGAKTHRPASVNTNEFAQMQQQRPGSSTQRTSHMMNLSDSSNNGNVLVFEESPKHKKNLILLNIDAPPVHSMQKRNSDMDLIETPSSTKVMSEMTSAHGSFPEEPMN